jgi:hypothetical protein
MEGRVGVDENNYLWALKKILSSVVLFNETMTWTASVV